MTRFFLCSPLEGALLRELVAGTNITLDEVGGTLVINASGGSSLSADPPLDITADTLSLVLTGDSLEVSGGGLRVRGLTIASGKALTVNNTMTLVGASDGLTATVQATGRLVPWLTSNDAVVANPGGGNARGVNAVDLQTSRSLAAQVASGAVSVISGGANNKASGDLSGVLGGEENTASGLGAAVLGGGTNTASGNYSATLGGANNVASGANSLAGGSRAKATHQGSIVLADSQVADYNSHAVDSFNVRAAGGVFFSAGLTAGQVLESTTDGKVQSSTLIKSGAGVLTLIAASDYTLTALATGPIVVGDGTGAVDYIPVYTLDGNTIGASTLQKSGAGVLELIATGDYTLTIPGTGTAVLGSGDAYRVGVWTSEHLLEGEDNFTWDGTMLYLNGAVQIDNQKVEGGYDSYGLQDVYTRFVFPSMTIRYWLPLNADGMQFYIPLFEEA